MAVPEYTSSQALANLPDLSKAGSDGGRPIATGRESWMHRKDKDRSEGIWWSTDIVHYSITKVMTVVSGGWKDPAGRGNSTCKGVES